MSKSPKILTIRIFEIIEYNKEKVNALVNTYRIKNYTRFYDSLDDFLVYVDALEGFEKKIVVTFTDGKFITLNWTQTGVQFWKDLAPITMDK